MITEVKTKLEKGPKGMFLHSNPESYKQQITFERLDFWGWAIEDNLVRMCFASLVMLYNFVIWAHLLPLFWV